MKECFSNMIEGMLDFPDILNVSIAASWMVLAVLVLRLILKKAPKWIRVVLWGLVAIRLLLPFSIESAFSLIPSAQTIPEEVLRYEGIQLKEPTHLDVISNPIISGNVSIELEQTVDRLQNHMIHMTFIWLIGIMILFLYTIISYWTLHRKVDTAVLYRGNVFQSENVRSPFVLGIIRPRVYLPFNMDVQDMEHVIAHEQAHLKRKDHWWKPLGFFLLAIHWFNPVMWLGYIVLCRDIELACDEKVIKELGNEQRADYTQALVSCSINRRLIAACPLAFGEVGVKERVKSVMNYRKPTFWIVIVSICTCAIVAICFLTNPVGGIDLSGVESVTVDNVSVSEEAGDELITLIDTYRRSPFTVGMDDPNSLSRAIRLNCSNGDYYLLHYQYYSGFSFNPLHAGEDAYRSILTLFDKEDGAIRAWKMEYDFDAKLKGWLADYASPNLGALSLGQVYGVVEVTYESPVTNYSMVAQENTPEYMIDENRHLFSVKEHSETWTDLGELCEITITKEDFDELFRSNSGKGWFSRESASEVRKNTAKAWRVIYDQDVLYYILQRNNGELYLAYGYYDYSEKDDPGSDDTYIRWLYKIAPVEKQGDKSQETVQVIDIVDPTKNTDFSYDTAMELFFEDESSKYYFSGIYSEHVIVYYSDGTQEDIVAALNGGNVTIDGLDRFGIAYWAEPKMEDLSAAIISAIRERSKSDKQDGLFDCASFVLLKQEELCIDSDPPSPMQVTVYGIALRQEFGFSGHTFHETGGSHIPTAITFDVVDGEYIMKEYWIPRDGSYYEPDIRDKFPNDIEDEAMDTEKYILAQKQECYEQAVQYGNVDTDFAIEYLFQEIESSPVESSKPKDYIKAHPIEYRELTYYGDYTLKYIFTKFLEGEQTGLRGQLMRLLLDDLAPEAQLRLYVETGQEYFDEWKAGAIRVSEQHDIDWLKEKQPAMYLLLQMIVD